MTIIGINNLVDQSFDMILDSKGIAYNTTELGIVGACHIIRYDYLDRVAYERTGMIDVDSSVSKVVVCDSRIDDESADNVNNLIVNS